jgi:hypothetical protein
MTAASLCAATAFGAPPDSSLTATGQSAPKLVLHGQLFAYDSKTDGWKSAGAAPAEPHVYPSTSSAARFENINMFFVNPDDGTTDACSPDYSGPCSPPAVIKYLGDCADRSWMSWISNGMQYLAKQGPEGITVFSPGVTGMSGSILRDFVCDENAGLPYFATGKPGRNGFEAGGAGVLTQDENGWRAAYTQGNGLPDNHVQAMTAQNGDLWVLTWTGVARIKASGGMTSWSVKKAVLSADTTALPSVSGGWQIGSRLAKGASLKVLSSYGSYYCVETPAYTGWVHESVLLRNRGKFSDADVHQSQDLASPSSAGADKTGCTKWTRNPDQDPDGEWTSVSANRALVPMSATTPLLEKAN